MTKHWIETNPCVGICVAGYGPNGEYCIGCYRTDEERTEWRNYTDEERDNVVSQCTVREEEQENA